MEVVKGKASFTLKYIHPFVSKKIFMSLEEAIVLIRDGVNPEHQTWIDLGAGTGLFTLALAELLTREHTIIAADKNPHALYRLNSPRFQIAEADFNSPMDLPVADGILMANTLHYASDPIKALKNILQHLRKGGTFLLIEYDMSEALKPWVPYPVPFELYRKIAREVGLSAPKKLKEMPSRYGPQNIYSAITFFGERGTENG